MTKYILRRLLVSVPVVFAMILATFAMIQALPGGPFDNVGERAMPEQVRILMERRYGLDKPLYEQFFVYVGNLMQGDFGPLLRSTSQDVNDVVAQTFPVSIQLGLLALILGFVIGIPAGVLAALKHNSALDHTATFVAVLGVSIPNLVLGPLLILIFGVYLDWFPIAFWGANPPFILGFLPRPTVEFWTHAALPTVTLGTGLSAVIARLTRAGLLDVLNEDYIRTARAKGLREALVINRHALRNSLIPVVTILGPLLAAIVTGSLITELIFALNGMGRQFVGSVQSREYFLLTSLTLIYGVLLIMGNLLVDIMYAWLDPRIRYD
jgi:oligopeptide transport system permease protein